MPLVSVVVPVLADTAAAQRLAAQIPADSRVELIVVDGGHEAGLDRLTDGRAHVRIVRTAPGRGRQMNAGAAVAGSPWLWFVHADSTLPPDWLPAFERGFGGAAGGWFAFALDDAAWQARMIERGVNYRVALFRLPYGDQGLFVRRDVFTAMGGFRDLPLMEDVDFVRRLRRRGRLAAVPLPLITSARRWRRDGWFRRSARNLVLVTLYFAGISPHRLARWY
jgi:rSAM/selenodomain-associated transferase 2